MYIICDVQDYVCFKILIVRNYCVIIEENNTLNIINYYYASVTMAILNLYEIFYQETLYLCRRVLHYIWPVGRLFMLFKIMYILKFESY